MDKVRTVFEGVVIIGLLLFVDITALCLCLKGICDENWLISNVIVCSIFELVLCIWMCNHIRRGALEILKKTKNLELLKTLYVRIKYYAFFGILFGLIQFSDAIGIFRTPIQDTSWQFIYACNVLLVSVFLFLWMYYSIKEIKRQQEF